MSSTYVPPLLRPFQQLRKSANAPVDLLARLGHQVFFLLRSIGSIPLALKHYPKEVWRLLSDVSWGNGNLVVGGGTIGVVVILSAFGGMTVGIQGYNSLNLLGLSPITGAISAFATTRELGPLLATIAFAAQAGCRFTAQLGAMRISEEIDALEAIGIRPVPFVVTTRVIAGMITIVPLYLLTLILSYLSCAVVVNVLHGQSSGTYYHYFDAFLQPGDVIASLIKATVFVVMIILIHGYQGFYATGGPEGVGRASGRAIRASLVLVVIADMIMTIVFWGLDVGIKISG